MLYCFLLKPSLVNVIPLWSHFPSFPSMHIVARLQFAIVMRPFHWSLVAYSLVVSCNMFCLPKTALYFVIPPLGLVKGLTLVRLAFKIVYSRNKRLQQMVLLSKKSLIFRVNFTSWWIIRKESSPSHCC